MKRLYALTLGLPLAAALLLHYGCGSSDETIGPPGTGGGAASGAGSGTGGIGFGGSSTGTTGTGTAQTGGSGQGASGGGTGLADAGDFDADFGYDAPPFDADLGDACVDEVATADPVPLDIYFMLDRSGSMGTDCNVGSTTASKWCRAINSIAGYIQDASATGNQAAIQYFPLSGDDPCGGSLQASPAVGLGLLPGHASSIISSMNGIVPNGSYTPIEPGLRGLASFTAANEAPPRIIIGILITDGQPNRCSTTATTLRNISGTHFSNTGIHTFVIGMTGASFSTLETIASYSGALQHDDTNDACGTCDNCTCHHYNVGDGNPTVFIAALQQIQNSVLGCTFNIPTPSQGVLDPDTVSVEYLPNGQPPAQDLPRVTNAGACSGAGWYYDDNTNPTIINLCPASCTTVQGDPNAEINIRIACQGS